MLALSPSHRALAAQVVRYALTGGVVTAFGVAAYWAGVSHFALTPLVANAVAYLVSMALGYVLHARFSFRDTAGAASVGQGGKFFLTSGISFTLNSLFVWLLTGPLTLPNWTPILTMVFVTPAICFVIYRFWVFR